MARDEAPPFARGATWYGGDTPDSTDLTGSDSIIGKEWVFEDRSPSSVASRTNRPVRVRAVRNTSGIALVPKRIGNLSSVAGEYGNSVDSYVTTTAAEGYPIDEYLPSAGVVDDDVFYIIIEGPAMVTVGLTAGIRTNFSVGDWLVSQTAATSQATTAGRGEQFTVTATSTNIADEMTNMVLNRIGRALTAKTTANTGADVLCDVGHW